jgi:hypothetical protein
MATAIPGKCSPRAPDQSMQAKRVNIGMESG